MSDHASAVWVGFYQHNAQSLMEVPWDADYALSEAERSAIAQSIAEFQKGESSEGKHLLAASTRMAEQLNDPAYREASVLFIKEEQRHARDLKRYMQSRDLALAKSAWPDTVFRGLRHLGGLEVSIVVLVTAEIIAQSYYPALKQATEDPVLIRLCEQIIRDEDAHVQFQAERVASLRKGAGGLRRGLSQFLHRFLFWGTRYVVWFQHARVYKKAGLRYRDYSRECWALFDRYEAQLKDTRWRTAVEADG